MVELAKTDEALAQRMHLLKHRVPEELYDVVADPDCLNNLIEDPAHQPVVEQLSVALEAHMRRTGDHALAAFVGRKDPANVANYMRQQQEAKREQRAFVEAVRAAMEQEGKDADALVEERQ